MRMWTFECALCDRELYNTQFLKSFEKELRGGSTVRSRCFKSLVDYESISKSRGVLYCSRVSLVCKSFWVDLSQEGEAANEFFGIQALGVQRHTVRTHLEASADPTWLACSQHSVTPTGLLMIHLEVVWLDLPTVWWVLLCAPRRPTRFFMSTVPHYM